MDACHEELPPLNNPAAERLAVCGNSPMFLSLPQYEFQAPQGLGEPGSRHWRVVELPLHALWFLLTVSNPDPEGDGLGRSHTLCIAWELDLVEALRAIGPDRVRGLVAMMPAWSTPTGQWSSRLVTEVWLDADESGKFVTFTDAAGERFGGRIRGNPPKAGAAPKLLLHLPPGKARAPRRRPPGAGRGRQRVARAAE